MIVEPEYAYGPIGFPPRIPPDETIIYNIRIKHVMDDFCDRFVRMNIHERRLIPLSFIIIRAKMLSDKAKASFTRARSVLAL